MFASAVKLPALAHGTAMASRYRRERTRVRGSW